MEKKLRQLLRPENNKEIERKWTKPLTDAGWTAIPNVIFERQAALGLDALDVVIILHLSGYWWKAGNDPYPSKKTLAEAIGVHPRTVQRRIAVLEDLKFIKRKSRKASHGGNLTNEYSLQGLIDAAEPFALEHVKERERRKAEATDRPRRRKPRLAVV